MHSVLAVVKILFITGRKNIQTSWVMFLNLPVIQDLLCCWRDKTPLLPDDPHLYSVSIQIRTVV